MVDSTSPKPESGSLLYACELAADYFHDFTEQDDEETELAKVCREAINIARENLPPATSEWQPGSTAPKDGSVILALFDQLPYVVSWEEWEVGGESPMYYGGQAVGDVGSPSDGFDSGWCVFGLRHSGDVIDNEPQLWARILTPLCKDDANYLKDSSSDPLDDDRDQENPAEYSAGYDWNLHDFDSDPDWGP